MNLTIFALFASRTTAPLFASRYSTQIVRSHFRESLAPVLMGPRLRIFHSTFEKSTGPAVLATAAPYTITGLVVNHTEISGEFFGSLDVSNSLFSGCESDTSDGGAIYVTTRLYGGWAFPVSIVDTTFVNCSSRRFDGCGGAVCLVNAGEVKFERCCCVACSASDGVFIHFSFGDIDGKYTSDLSVIECAFAGTTARAGGNSLYAGTMSALMTDVNVSNNVVAGVGAAFTLNVERHVAVSRTLASNNTGASVAVLRGWAPFFGFKYNSFVENSANVGLQMIGTYTIEDCVFNNEKVATEVSIENGVATLKDCVFGRDMDDVNSDITLINPKIDSGRQAWAQKALKTGYCVAAGIPGKLPKAIDNDRGYFANYVPTIPDMISFVVLGLTVIVILILACCVLYHWFCARPSLFQIGSALRGDAGATLIDAEEDSTRSMDKMDISIPIVVEGKVELPMSTVHESDLSSDVKIEPFAQSEPEDVAIPPPPAPEGNESESVQSEPVKKKRHKRHKRKKTSSEDESASLSSNDSL